MDTKQINDALEKLFREERIVFWNDPDREFVGLIDEIKNRFTTDNTESTDLVLSNDKSSSSVPSVTSVVQSVKVIRLDHIGALDAKLLIERVEPDTKFLVYAPVEEPDFESDWLLDIRLYSRSFRADRASILLEELGLKSLHLREHLAQRRKFCDNKDRLQKLKTLVNHDDTADDLDRKMLAVVVKADQPELYNILRTVCSMQRAVDREEDDDDESADCLVRAAHSLAKFDLDEPFWRFIKKGFGYSEDSPNLENLLIRLLVTDFAQHLVTEKVSGCVGVSRRKVANERVVRGKT